MNPAALRSRQKNAAAIVRYLIKSGEVSRTELASVLGLSTATVTNIVTDLIRSGLVYESGSVGSALGRKAKLLRFNARRNYTLAVDLSSASGVTTIYLCDLLGAVERKASLSIPFTLTGENPDALILEHIIRAVTDFLSGLSPEEQRKLRVAAVSLPGILNGNDSTIYAPAYNWKNLPLVRPLSAALSVPVYFENITRMKSIFELSYVEPEERNVIYLALSPGIGMVHFFDRHMVEGRYGLAGEVGHMTLDAHGPLCYCGNRGCFELYCDEHSLLRTAKKLADGEDRCEILHRLVHEKGRPLTIATLIEARDLGSLKVHNALSQISFYLGCALTNLINCFDPDRIIISGNLIDLDDYVFSSAIEEAKSKIINRFAREVHISKAKLATSELNRAICVYVLDKIVDKLIAE